MKVVTGKLERKATASQEATMPDAPLLLPSAAVPPSGDVAVPFDDEDPIGYPVAGQRETLKEVDRLQAVGSWRVLLTSRTKLPPPPPPEDVEEFERRWQMHAGRLSNSPAISGQQPLPGAVRLLPPRRYGRQSHAFTRLLKHS